jgi:hypothetical protein
VISLRPTAASARTQVTRKTAAFRQNERLTGWEMPSYTDLLTLVENFK